MQPIGPRTSSLQTDVVRNQDDHTSTTSSAYIINPPFVSNRISRWYLLPPDFAGLLPTPSFILFFLLLPFLVNDRKIFAQK